MTNTALRRLLPLAGLAALAVAAPAAAQDFSWTGRLADGRTIEVKNVNGNIEAVAASGSDVRVTATKRARRSDPETVRIEVVEHSGGVTICAVYPRGRDGRENECVPGRGGRMSNDRNDTQVDFRVEVPGGVRLVARSVNGNVQARGLSQDVEAVTVNGKVTVSTTGLARATSVNGSLDIEMGRGAWDGEVEFETVNGSITITMSGDVHADVSASTVNGSISTDYPLTIQGRFGPKRLRGTIGDGGGELVLSTVNGSISLRRR